MKTNPILLNVGSLKVSQKILSANSTSKQMTLNQHCFSWSVYILIPVFIYSKGARWLYKLSISLYHPLQLQSKSPSGNIWRYNMSFQLLKYSGYHYNDNVEFLTIVPYLQSRYSIKPYIGQSENAYR